MVLEFFNAVNAVLWGPATLLLFMGTGFFLMCRLKWLPLRKVFYAVRLLIHSAALNKDGKDKAAGDISAFQSLMTSLAACIGTGNIAGVASAMVLGGPGALVWMNISALLGLSSIFTESLLAIMYRRKNKNNEMSGGPMYVMADGIGGCPGRLMAAAFSIFTVGASFGIGNMTQSNTAAGALKLAWQLPEQITGIAMAALTLLVIVGGIQSVGKFCGIFVPVSAVIYTGACLLVIVCHADGLLDGLKAIKWGVARGVFSNEAGLGSAPIAAAAARCNHPVHQAYIQMTGPVFDTVVMCTLTGLAICASGCLGTAGADGVLYDGAALTAAAFATVLGPAADDVICAAMIGFAMPTIIGWAYYGEKALEYMTDKKAVLWAYKIAYSGAVFLGAIKPAALIWAFSDMMNGLMALPNLLTLILLGGQAANYCTKDLK